MEQGFSFALGAMAALVVAALAGAVGAAVALTVYHLRQWWRWRYRGVTCGDWCPHQPHRHLRCTRRPDHGGFHEAGSPLLGRAVAWTEVAAWTRAAPESPRAAT